MCCYVHRSIQHLFKWQVFSVHAVQRYNLRHTTTVKATLCIYKFTRVCHFSKQFPMHRPSHFLQKYHVLRVCLASEHTRHRRRLPLSGQCWECFTSSRLSWDAIGLGLPLEVSYFPLANGKSIRERKFHRNFCASICRHMTCVYEMRWGWSCLLSEKTVSWSTSMFCRQFHSCWPFCLTCPQTPCVHYSLLQHVVW